MSRFVPKDWQDDVAGGTPITEAELDRLEAALDVLHRKRHMAVLANYAAAAAAGTATAVGIGAATLSATVTTVHPTADAHFLNHATGAVAGNASGMNLPTACLRSAQPEFWAKIRTGSAAGDITSCRIWVGLGGAIATMNGSSTPNTAYACFRYDPSIDTGTKWRAVVGTATASLTVVDTGVTIAADTAYLMAIRFTAAAVTFYINGVLVATISTTLPGNTIAFVPQVQITTTAVGAKNIRWTRMHVFAD